MSEKAKWVESLWGFTNLNFKLNLKVSAFYLEKQKSFISKKMFFCAVVNIKTKKLCLLTQFSGRFWIRFRDFRNLILPFYSLVFFRHFLRMLRLVVFSSKTKSYQEQKTREIAMAKPAKVISNKSCVELSITMYNI